MGTEYYIAHDGSQELFLLGKGEWEKLEHPMSRSVLKNAVVAHIVDRAEPDDTMMGARRMANMVVEWCQNRLWQVRLINDAQDDFQKVANWKITGEIYAPPADLEFVRKQLELGAAELLDRFGMDSLEIVAHVVDVPETCNGDLEVQRKGWVFSAAVGNIRNASGYRRIELSPCKLVEESAI